MNLSDNENKTIRNAEKMVGVGGGEKKGMFCKASSRFNGRSKQKYSLVNRIILEAGAEPFLDRYTQQHTPIQYIYRDLFDTGNN